MSPDQVCEMWRAPASSRRTRGPLSGLSGAPSFSQTYLCRGDTRRAGTLQPPTGRGDQGSSAVPGSPCAGHQVALQDWAGDGDTHHLPAPPQAGSPGVPRSPQSSQPRHTHLTSTLGSWVTPQLMMALVPLMTLWSCGGSVMRVLAAGDRVSQWHRRGGTGRGQPKMSPIQTNQHPCLASPNCSIPHHGRRQRPAARGAGRVCPTVGTRALCRQGDRQGLTPNHQVSGGFVHAAGVGGQAGVGAGVGAVRGADEQAARLQQRETRQLHRPAGQDPLPWVTW